MPGIAGIFGRGDGGVQARAVRSMVNAMRHEPTYVTGTLSEPSLGIHVGWAAHAGSFSDCMPAWNETRDVCLVFAGEDFTDRDDIARLQARGHDCEAGSAHYLVHLYEESGLRFLRALNGWFSGVLIDLRERRAVLFNDRFGLHRLHYHERPDGLYFASEAKSLLRVLPELRGIDHAALAELFRCGCVLQGKTLFPGIEQVPGGAMWAVTPQGGVAKGQYFESQEWERQPPMSAAEFRESLGATFARVLPRYLRGTGDVAMSLTGGLDGRMIMAWARPTPGALPCYTFAGEYRDCADVTIARIVAAMCGQPHQTLSVGRAFCDEFGTLAEKSVYISDGAMDVTGSVELYANKLARRIAPIRLTGNYGSEIVRGNIAFGPGYVAKGFLSEEFLPHFRAAGHAFDSVRDCTDLSFVAFRQVPWYHYARFSVEQSQLTPRSPYLDNDLVALMYRAPPGSLHSRKPSLVVIAQGDGRLARLPTDRGRVIESSRMAGALRDAIQELTVKAEYAYDYGMPQWLSAVDHVLSPLRLERFFLGRHKFYHFRVWYRDRLAGYVKEVLLDHRSLMRPYLERGFVERMVKHHVKGTRNYTTEIHLALTAELAHRTLVEQG